MTRAMFAGSLLLVGAVALAAHIKRGDVASAVFGDTPTLSTFLSAPRVTAQRLQHRALPADFYTLPAYTRGPAIIVPPAQLMQLRKLFTDSKSYTWSHVPDEHGRISEKMCLPDYGVLLTFRDGESFVQIALCFECDLFAVFVGGGANPRRVNTEEDFDLLRAQLIDIACALFPRDREIQALQLARPNQTLQPKPAYKKVGG
jgi:hypothetical protein